MVKFYIAVEDGKVICNWGQCCEGIDPEYSSKYSDIREVSTPNAVTEGFPLSCYTSDWQLKSPEEMKNLGYDDKGEKLPTAAELAAQQAKEADEKAKEKALDAAKRRLMLSQDLVGKSEMEAREQALKELVGKREAEILAANPKLKYIETARGKQKGFETELKTLGGN